MNKLKTSTNARQRQAPTPKSLKKGGAKATLVSADLATGEDPADDLARFYLSPAVQSSIHATSLRRAHGPRKDGC